ncbi:MAG: response regulator [Burkholderiaceae bacterium]|nr:response regulator [Burkholderiaceae bacterium]
MELDDRAKGFAPHAMSAADQAMPLAYRHFRIILIAGIVIVSVVWTAVLADIWMSRKSRLEDGDRTLRIVAHIVGNQVDASLDQMQKDLRRNALAAGGVPAAEGLLPFSNRLVPQVPGAVGVRLDHCADGRQGGVMGSAQQESCRQPASNAESGAPVPANSEVSSTPREIPIDMLLPSANKSEEVAVKVAFDCRALISIYSGPTADSELLVGLGDKNATFPRCSVPENTWTSMEGYELARMDFDDRPLSVFVARPRSDILRSWRFSAASALVRTTTISVFVFILIFVVFRQAKKQERANVELRASEQRWRAAFDHAEVGIFLMLSPLKRILIANTAFQRMLGYSMDELRTLGSADITYPEDMEITRSKMGELDRGEKSSVQFEKRYVHRDGHIVCAEISVSRFTDSEVVDGVFVGVVADVTVRCTALQERLRLEAQLRQSQKLEALGTFASGIAHDFNNILSVILGYGERAYRAIDEESPVRRHIEQVLHAGARARSLVERILMFSRSSMVKREPVHVASIVDETVGLLRAGLRPGISLDVEMGAPDTYILGDATHLHQVIMNLCNNALHAIELNGTITISVFREKISDAVAMASGTLQAGEYVCISVSDTGVGISAEVQERMFEPFFTTRKTGEGTGLGLSLVDGIVKECGGAISVKSQLKHGTRFAIYLPVTDQRMGASVATSVEELPFGNGESVLVVDDERPLVDLGEEVLAELGYEPVGFDSPEDAWLAFAADPQRFDLVLSDQTMPGMTGLHLLERIRALRPDLPLLLMSGYSTAELDEAARRIGIVSILRKPIGRAKLARLLHHALQT